MLAWFLKEHEEPLLNAINSGVHPEVDVRAVLMNNQTSAGFSVKNVLNPCEDYFCSRRKRMIEDLDPYMHLM